MLKDLGTVDAVEDLASQEMLTDPFMEGRDVEAIVDCDAFNGTAILESSEDDEATWVAELTVTEGGSDRTVRAMVTLKRHMRWTCTVWTAGEADCHLRAGE